jgi:hypothetical protein
VTGALEVTDCGRWRYYNPADRSRQSGFMLSISFSFFERRRSSMSFSRAIAARTFGVCSKYTSVRAACLNAY